MKLVHWLVAGSILLGSCASNMTPEQKERRDRADRVGDIVDTAGVHLGLSPLERAMLSQKARKIAWSEDPLQSGLDELDKHPGLEQRASQWLQEKNAGDVLGELGRENSKLQQKADRWLHQHPDAAQRVYELFGR